MSNLVVRKIPFEFEGVEFLWNPSHPEFSTAINQISFWVLGLERYFVRAMIDAEKIIKNPLVLQEAQLFRKQEAQHSSSHRKHVNELIKKYPALQETLDKVIRSYDKLYDSENLKFHLAYSGGLEATFTPVFKLIIDNRDILFADGDSRVASLNLWHFCEEVEHRSSAIMVYNEIYGSHLYRLRVFPQAIIHTLKLFKMMERDFIKYVPKAERHAKPIPTLFHSLKGVNKIDMFKSVYAALLAQRPGHDAANEPLPEWSFTTNCMTFIGKYLSH